MQKRPYVVVNMAVTADGKIDTFERRGARISGAADRLRVDRLRASADAVLVGGKTLLAEDPRLTVRDVALQQERLARRRVAQPAKVGIVTRLEPPGGEPSLPRPSRFLSEGDGPVVIFTTSQTRAQARAWLEAEGVEVHVHDGDRVDLERALMSLAASGAEQVMVEGGSTLVAALLEASLVDEIQLAIAPLLFGGVDAPTPFGGAGLAWDRAVGLTLLSASPDDDGQVVLRYQVDRKPSA